MDSGLLFVVLFFLGLAILAVYYYVQQQEVKKQAQQRIDNRVAEIGRQIVYLRDKYGAEVASKLINEEFWIGMTAEQLVDSKGEPSSKEVEQLKTKVKETYVYGNKSRGDYFVIENGIVVKIVDR